MPPAGPRIEWVHSLALRACVALVRNPIVNRSKDERPHLMPSPRTLMALAEAVDNFCLTSGRFPETTDALITAHLATSTDLADPWGKPYRSSGFACRIEEWDIRRHPM